MKKILISFLCGMVFITPAVFAATVNFPDVSTSQWFYQDVVNMVEWGVIKGNSNGTFAPERNVNRAELSAMWNRYNDYLKTQFVAKSQASSGSSSSISSSTSNSSVTGQQHEVFEFSGFEWKILGAKKYSALGRSNYLQSPKNNYFLIIEAEIKNLTSSPKYMGSHSVINDVDGQQHDDSSTVSVYGEDQMGYAPHGGKVEGQAKVKTFFGFDVNAESNDFLLVLKPWFGGDERAQVNIKTN